MSVLRGIALLSRIRQPMVYSSTIAVAIAFALSAIAIAGALFARSRHAAREFAADREGRC